MKRILFIIFVISLNFLNATSLSSNKNIYSTKKTGGKIIMFRLKYLPGETIEADVSPASERDWIGIYPQGSSNAWKNIKAWKSLSSSKYTHVSINASLKAGEYEERLFFRNTYKVISKVTFSVSSTPKETIVDKVNAYCKGGPSDKNYAIICPNQYDNLAHAIDYKKYNKGDGHRKYDLVTVYLNDNAVRIHKGDQDLSMRWPVESVSLERLKHTPIYIYKKSSRDADQNYYWTFMYEGTELLHFSSNDGNGMLSNIHTTNRGKNLVLSYIDFNTRPDRTIVTKTYDISDPTVAKLIKTTTKPQK